jgi:hypothetical protein
MTALATSRIEEEMKLTSFRQKRLANKDEALATDWSFANGTNLGGIVFFQCADSVKPLGLGEKYFYQLVKDLPEELQEATPDHVRRLCVETSAGDTRFVCFWSERGSTLHNVVDMGSSSWPIQSVLFDSSRGRIRGSFDYDQPHRHHRHHINALQWSALSNMSSDL